MAIQAWLTVIIAAIALLIAYFQWITAHQRIVLDLFEKRTQLFNSIELVIGQVLTDGETSNDTLQAFLQAEADARFLFGDDVLRELVSLTADRAFLNEYTKAAIDDPNLPDRDNIFRERWDILRRLGDDWQRRLAQNFEPYMRLSQKQRSIWWPF